MTSEDEKTVHQQCNNTTAAPLDPVVCALIEERAAYLACSCRQKPPHCPYCNQRLLAAEVRRLREENEKLHERTSIALGVGDGSGQKFVYGNSESIAAAKEFILENKRLREELKHMRAERDELIAYGDGWKQQWTEMRDTMWKPAMDKLERVEALPAKWRASSHNGPAAARDLEAALAD